MSSSAASWTRRLLTEWEAFWFREVPPHSYALLRILFGLLGFVSVLGMTPVDQFWTPDGLFAAPAGGPGLNARILELGYGPIIGRGFFAAMAASYAALAAGYRTESAVVICFVGTVFQPFWNLLPLSSAHQVVVVVLFCLLWVDCGRVWSIDAWRARARARPKPGAPLAEPIWPLRLIRFQVALIYFNSGLWKFNGELWRDGSAVHYSMALNVFHRFPGETPAALDWLSTLATYVTLAWEIGVPLLILHPWTRWPALVIGILLHAGMGVALELGPFSAIMIASYVAFLKPETVARFSWRDIDLRAGRPRGPVAASAASAVAESRGTPP